MKEELEDKYNLREILVRNQGFTPQLLQELEHHIDIILKVDYMEQHHLDE